MKRTRKVDTGERNPISIVSCRVPFTPSPSKKYSDNVDLRFHPTQKPIELLQYLIKTFSNENETVLDFTFGSCSTGIACLNTNRRFIGIELDDNYFDIGAERMRNHIKNE